MTEPTRVLIVDDSRLFRAVLQDALAGVPGVRVVGSVWNGEKAVEFLRGTPVDLVTLDLEMPRMGGLDALREIARFNADRPAGYPPVGVLVVSAHSRQGAAVTIEALEAGAFDFITKPAGPDPAANLEFLRAELAAKVRLFRSRRRAVPSAPSATPPPPVPPPLGPKTIRPVRAVMVGVSTGGPRALTQLLPELTRRVEAPIFIVQHIQDGFISPLAESITKKCPRPAEVARDGVPVAPGGIYLGPWGRHLLVRTLPNGTVVTALSDQPPLHGGFRPAADVLFRSGAVVYGPAAVGIVLTGMGQDGTDGLGAMKRAGAYTIAQDEATSSVWGMPGSAVAAGYVDQVLPLDRIAAAVQAVAAGGR